MASPLEIEMFPCLWDNYGFLIHSPDTGETAAIDTPEAAKITEACERKGWTLTHIWNTHHHPDHVGGNLELQKTFGVDITGPAHDAARIPGITTHVTGGDVFDFAGHEVRVINTPGHTDGHIVYYVPSAGAAFVGDTVFVLGCGRLFEGTPAQMYESLQQLAALPDDTKVYCAHEYTLSNAAFAVTIEPNNADLLAYVEKAKALRAQDLPTVPTTILAEKANNPFVRAKSAKQLGIIRAAKDQF
ncbi:MAG: hydroxyacylglutathione hydrolase [Alphaproteobacteria bacterium]